MKMKFLFLAALVSLTSSFAHAGDSAEILESTVVKSTFALMQAKHGGSCTELKTSNVHWMCTGVIPQTDVLEIFTAGCAFAVKIECPNESGTIFGEVKTVYAVDSSGIRDDIKQIDLGISFTRIDISATR